MKSSLLSPRPLLLAVAALIGATAAPAPADVIFETSFDGANGTIPDDTTLTLGTTANAAISGNEFRTAAGETRLVYSGDGAASLADYTIETTFRRANGGGWTGLIARANTAPGDHSGYLVRLNRAGAGQPHELFQLVRVNAAGAETALDSETFADEYTSPEVWRMTLTVNGDAISAELYDNANALVAQASATDGTLTAGTGGLRAQHGAASIYQKLTIIAVPEPGTMGLLGAGLFLALSRATRP